MTGLNLSRLAVCISFALLAGPVSANIQSQMDSMFESMSNTTAPGAYETATRGVIAGGSLKIRNQIATAPLVSFRPPSVQAGCGGIDMFAGSFSFINAQQFVQSLRSVASNAVGVASGYAFKLALKAMGPTPANVIESLQEVMQKMNEMMSNSCQLATGLVADTFEAFTGKRETEASAKAMISGIGDAFSSFKSSNTDGGKTSEEKINEAGNDKACESYGNVLWCAMASKNTSAFFKYGSNQTQEIIMSMVGSVVLGPTLDDAPDGKGKTRLNEPVFPLDGVDLISLIESTKEEKISIYSCGSDTDTCLEPEPKEIAFDGLAKKVESAFNGSASSPGIIYKWATNTGTFNNDERQIIAALQATGFSAMIQKLSQRSEAIANGFVSEHSKLIARDAIYSLAKSYITAARASMVGSPMTSALGENANDFLQRASQELNTQYTAALDKYGSNAKMMADFTNKMELMPSPNLLSFIGTKTAPSTN